MTADPYTWPDELAHLRAGRRFRCCEHCEDAKDDHAEYGGTVQKDEHDLPCDTCLYDAEVQRRVTHGLADLRAENTLLRTAVDGVAALAAESLAVRRKGCDTYGLVAASRINALIKEAKA